MHKCSYYGTSGYFQKAVKFVGGLPTLPVAFKSNGLLLQVSVVAQHAINGIATKCFSGS